MDLGEGGSLFGLFGYDKMKPWMVQDVGASTQVHETLCLLFFHFWEEAEFKTKKLWTAHTLGAWRRAALPFWPQQWVWGLRWPTEPAQSFPPSVLLRGRAKWLFVFRLWMVVVSFYTWGWESTCWQSNSPSLAVNITITTREPNQFCIELFSPKPQKTVSEAGERRGSSELARVEAGTSALMLIHTRKNKCTESWARGGVPWQMMTSWSQETENGKQMSGKRKWKDT